MDLTHLKPHQRVSYIVSRIKEPCPPGLHTYEDLIEVIGETKIPDQICTTCFNFKGWVHNREDEE